MATTFYFYSREDLGLALAGYDVRGLAYNRATSAGGSIIGAENPGTTTYAMMQTYTYPNDFSGDPIVYATGPMSASVNMTGTISVQAYAEALTGTGTVRWKLCRLETDETTLTVLATSATASAPDDTDGDPSDPYDWAARTWSITSTYTFGKGTRLVLYPEAIGSTAAADPLLKLNYHGTFFPTLSVTLPVSAVPVNVSKTATFYYNTCTAVAVLGTIDYTTLSLVRKDGTVDYHTREAVAVLAALYWNTLSNLTEVAQDGIIDYHTYNLVRVDGTLLYNTQVNIMLSMLHLYMWLSTYTDMDTRLSAYTDLTLEEVA